MTYSMMIVHQMIARQTMVVYRMKRSEVIKAYYMASSILYEYQLVFPVGYEEDGKIGDAYKKMEKHLHELAKYLSSKVTEEDSLKPLGQID